jgi:radical SAM superfamily enzyme YgiQ (UPF0313 family)
MFKDKRFRVRDEAEVMEDLEDAARTLSSGTKRGIKVFLADGDSLVLSNDKLLRILGRINALFPERRRTTSYGSPQDVLAKSPEELSALKAAGLDMIYIGAESGSNEVLRKVKKGATRAEIIEAIKKIEASGIAASVTFISGLAGAVEAAWKDHAIQTGTMITEAQPSYASLLTLMVDPAAPISKDIDEGKFVLLPPMDVMRETLLMIENAKPTRDIIFRANHASNYLPINGTLPGDREGIIETLKMALENENMLKDEMFRAL